VTVRLLGAERLTLKTAVVMPLLPSGTLLPVMLIVGGGSSSFWIVPVTWAWIRFAPDGFVRLTTTVSSGSKTVSPVTITVIVFVVSPGAKVRVPLVAA
jgi:hypothetical protein